MTLAFINDIRPFFRGKPVVYVDLGAHKGRVFTDLLRAELDLREAHLVEPNPASFAELERVSKKAAAVRTVRTYNIAIGDSVGQVTMKMADTMSRVLRDDAEIAAGTLAEDDVFEVRTETLDLLRLNVLDQHISILKIDVEGSELDVLRGAAELLSSQGADVIYIEAGMDRQNRQQCYYRDIEDHLEARGYRLFKIYEQKNEWVSDSPLLRRVNLAFMSRQFADNNPYQLSHDLFNADSRIEQLEAERIQLVESIAALEQRIATAQDELTAASQRAAALEVAGLAAEQRAAQQHQALEDRLRATELERATIDQKLSAVQALLETERAALAKANSEIERMQAETTAEEVALATASKNIARLRRSRDEARAESDAFESAAVSLVAALRKARHDQNHALAEQRERLRGQVAYRIGSTITRARSLRSLVALPGEIMRQRKASGRDGAGLIATTAADVEPQMLDVGDRIISHTPEFTRVRLQAEKAVFISGMVIGSRATRAPILKAAIRYLNASGRPLKTTAEGADTPLGETVEHTVEILAGREFQLSLPNPAKAALMEIAFITGPGDATFLRIDDIQQPRAETAERWLIEGRRREGDALRTMKRAAGLRPKDAEPLDSAERARRAVRRQVNHLRKRLLTLGFGQTALAELRRLIAETTDSDLRAVAAWELAVWHANRYTLEDANECLALLSIVEQENPDAQDLRRIAILRAESQVLTGDADAARETLAAALSREVHDDVHLAMTRIETSAAARLESVNQVLAHHGLELATFGEGSELLTPYDRLHAEAKPVASDVKVSIIIPAYNAETTIGTAIRSLLGQTWTNIEILVSDDCSTDGTAAVIEAFAQADDRVRLIHGQANSGPYVARNLAMLEATGEFVTCNDSDDWSHPRKIEFQAKHLLAHPDVIANTSPQARTNEDLVFHRRGNAGFYIQPNMSSLMFRREQVVDAIGYWDSVRFAADSEYTRRIRAVFGPNAVVDMDCGPLMFQRQTETSLTGSQAFGYHGFKMGARREYEEGHKRFHKANPKPYIGFPLDQRPFPAPEPMRPDRNRDREQRKHFDVIMVSDFRLPGGTNMSNVEEMKAQRRMGLKTGLVQMSRYDVSPDRSMNDRVAEQIDGDQVEMIVYGQKVECDLLILRLPWVLEEWQDHIPDIKARSVRVIVNQPPQRDYGPESPAIYRIPNCAVNLERYFGDRGVWRPIGPLVRDALTTHHADDLQHIDLGENWHNIIDLGEWRRPLRPARGARIRICRHSRDQYVKWPADREQLLQIYPDTDDYEVHVLGGAETPEAVLGGKLPKNWRVTEFGKAEPKQFLSKFDVFVYYTHPDWIESFGRVIFEAMAVGLPVILPRVYEPLFQDAAIYAEPQEVQARIQELMADDDVYQAQVDRAVAYIERHFGYGVHADRIGEAMGRDLSDALTGSPLDRSELALTGSAEALGGITLDALDKAGLALSKASPAGLADLAGKLVSDADAAMQRGPFSVVDKTTLPPGGDKHDYWHPAPYWHPNPDAANGLPYVRKDGIRVPGTVMYEPDSERYDRTRLQHLFDDSFILAAAWRATGQTAYIEKAAGHLRHWFIDPATRMAPHLKFAQVKPGHGQNRGSASGVIEMKDLYYYLDAVRLMTTAGVLSTADQAAFRGWLMDYARWLIGSDQGRNERRAHNNHGLYYDLQAGAVGAYLGERALVFRSLRDARGRIEHHFAPDGSQPHELTRTTTAHYCCFNFQGWANLATLAETWGVDLWTYETPDGRGLRKGAEWLLAQADAPWAYEQIDEFDEERFIPAFHALPATIRPPRPRMVPASPYGVKPRFYPHDGIRPYWNLK